jgi:UTP--glucose-1-phosphate uridylyltransferase
MMTKVRKAVITLAARGERIYPAADPVQKAMLPIVDSDGLYKPVLQIVAEEAFAAGIEEICLVVAPGDDIRYKELFKQLHDNLLKAYKDSEWAILHAQKIQRLLDSVHFSVQAEPKGYGNAVFQAKDFVKDDAFLLLLGDYLYVSALAGKRCSQQLVELALEEKCSVSAVNPVKEYLVNRYGTLTGKHLAGKQGVYQIDKIIEKPSLSQAELELQTPGLRMGYYLCFFGMHVLQPIIFELLKEYDKKQEIYGLTPALNDLVHQDKYLALEVKGNRYDTGRKFGLLQAQIALGLAGEPKEELLTTIVEQLALNK